ncbi:phosphate--acyl-ACP acyltransferase, partial [Candidatus Dependentiae bacterium]|nr:phosphate--acyl-ACP acyltransferase [Candidatus Dependentiae bacterium]
MKIMLDAHGGDFGIETTVTGAIEAANDLKDDTIILIGPEKEIWNFLHEKFSFPDNIEIINATDNIEMHESPTLSIKKKVNSSIVKGFNYLKNDDVDAFVSCGNTGAVMTGAFTIVGRIKGIQRPAISTYFPTKSE